MGGFFYPESDWWPGGSTIRRLVLLLVLVAPFATGAVPKPEGQPDSYCPGYEAQAANVCGSTGPALAVAAGGTHTCVLTRTLHVDCYGGPASREFNDRVYGLAAHVATSWWDTCIAGVDQRVECRGTYINRVLDFSGPGLRSLVSGTNHFCALLQNRNVVCWMGPAAYDHGYSGGDATAVSAGATGACMITTARNVVCISTPGATDATGHLAPYSGGDAAAVAVGRDYTCILRTDRTTVCRGSNDYGQANPDSSGTVVGLSAADYHLCMLRANGDVACQGHPIAGRAGPYAGADAVQVTAGGSHNCVVRRNGMVRCWGDGTAGKAADWPQPADPIVPVPGLDTSGSGSLADLRVQNGGATGTGSVEAYVEGGIYRVHVAVRAEYTIYAGSGQGSYAKDVCSRTEDAVALLGPAYVRPECSGGPSPLPAGGYRIMYCATARLERLNGVGYGTLETASACSPVLDRTPLG